MGQHLNFDFILFGATGDLAMRKILPALYAAHAADELNPNGRILGVSRSAFSRDEYLQKVEHDSKPLIQDLDEREWATFLARIDYQSLNFNQTQDFAVLAEKVKTREVTDCVVIYLSISPAFFDIACQGLANVGLNHSKVRIVLEKPLGTDLSSCQYINQSLTQYFDEQQIYRIDHYLGKESLQNLLPLRFANRFFEPIWNREFIQSVQISVAETLGVEGRGEFYDHIGALRDMVQNHLIQMLCFTAMEQPKSNLADDVRDAKLQLIQSLRIMTAADVAKNVIRGQYQFSDGIKGYLEESKVPSESKTETYVAIRVQIDNSRWAGVPFYLRTGKRLKKRVAEIVVNFKEQTGMFGTTQNRLIIQLQPKEEIKLQTWIKQAGQNNLIQTPLMLDLTQTAGRRADAYEILLREVIAGRLNLFNRRDELEAAWVWIMPILNAWESSDDKPKPYLAGSWGVGQARELLAENGDCWLEEQ